MMGWARVLVAAALVMVGGVAAGAADYETPQNRAAKAVLPAKNVRGPDFTVIDPVRADGYMYHFKVKSTYGLFQASGIGAPLHMQAEMFKHGAGLEIAHIPYRGDAPMLTALLAGDIDIGFMPVGTGVAQVQSGAVKGLAVTGRKRLKALPDLPTFAESGVKGLEDGSWYGLFAPAGTPRDIVLRLQKDMVEVLKSPDVIQRISVTGNEPVGSTPDEFAAFFKADVAKFAKVVADAKIPKLD